MSKPRVHLTGGDGMNWALDNDLNLTKRALEGIAEISSIGECSVIHSVWWQSLLRISSPLRVGKRIICHVSGEPFRYLALPEFSGAVQDVGLWVAQTEQAYQELLSIGLTSVLIPYTVDTGVFRPLDAEDPVLIETRRKWRIPADRYLIGNFHRDPEGDDLRSPKLVKGPDIFVEIVRKLAQTYQVHVLLAGPRRHWMRRRLEEERIPYTFVGKAVKGQDDVYVNVLPHSTLNVLYNLLDLYLVSSRSEGGPRSILEAAAAQCKVVSTPVGLALDLLEAECVYSAAVEAVDVISRDIRESCLQDTVPVHYDRVMQRHRPEKVVPLFQSLYENVEQIPVAEVSSSREQSTDMGEIRQAYLTMLGQRLSSSQASLLRRIWRLHPRSAVRKGRKYVGNLRSRLLGQHDDELTVCLWHEFAKPPYGGGNQFMLALRKALMRLGVKVVENTLHPDIDVYLLNAIHFDVDRFLRFSERRKPSVVHRIDGPIHLVRGHDRQLDEMTFRINAQFADYTVIQSAWTYQRIVETGYQPVNPVITHNAVDSSIFYSQGRIPFDRQRKIRLISSSWSGNPRKGGAIYKWIEKHLDWDRFEYTFVGHASEEFDRIRHLAPVPSDELAGLLRDHDIYITASQNDPCSNALVEALACGLPALYLNDGGHPELVGYGGLPFGHVDEILPQLDVLIENYETFQNLIVVPSMESVAGKYLALLRAAHGSNRKVHAQE